MNDVNLCVLNDESLKILIEEFMGIDVLFMEYNENKQDNIFEKVDDGLIDVVVVDKELYSLRDTLLKLKESRIKVIYAGHNTTIKELKEFFKRKEIFDYIEKSNFSEIEAVLNAIKISRKRKTKISFIGESGAEAILAIEEIIHIYYDRESRRGVIVTDRGDCYSKKNMSELEELFSHYQKFIRIDRGTIINIDRIVEIDYRNEFIKFDNTKKIGVGAKTLRNFRKELNLWEDGN